MASHVFLGGTIAKNTWRDTVIAELSARGIRQEQIYNPVFEHWTPEIQEQEERLKQNEEYLLVFVLASPDPSLLEQRFTAAYSLAEAIMHVYDNQDRTIVYFDEDGFDKRTLKGLKKIRSELQERHPKAKIVQSYAQLIDAIIWSIYR